jgi:hypothetical protein
MAHGMAYADWEVLLDATSAGWMTRSDQAKLGDTSM